jgi:uncharacterized membrane-anchored protein
MKASRYGFLLAFIVQAALLSWLVAGRAMLLANGEEVTLAVRPVDPRDLLRGDYVILSYQISTLDQNSLGGDRDFMADEPIYVTLAPQGDVWVASAIHKTMPRDAKGPVIRGTVGRVTAAAANCPAPCPQYGVTYGLEKFFVPEGEGRALEQLRNEEKLTADVAIGRDGVSALKRLRMNGQVLYEAGLF